MVELLGALGAHAATDKTITRARSMESLTDFIFAPLSFWQSYHRIELSRQRLTLLIP
jgi:hypothetical protein